MFERGRIAAAAEPILRKWWAYGVCWYEYLVAGAFAAVAGYFCGGGVLGTHKHPAVF